MSRSTFRNVVWLYIFALALMVECLPTQCKSAADDLRKPTFLCRLRERNLVVLGSATSKGGLASPRWSAAFACQVRKEASRAAAISGPGGAAWRAESCPARPTGRGELCRREERSSSSPAPSVRNRPGRVNG
jgi:hypothetical protein